MRITARGTRALAAVAALGLLTTFLSDIIIALMTSGMAALIIYALFDVSRRSKLAREMEITPSTVELKLSADSSKKLDFKIQSIVPLRIKGIPKWLHIERLTFGAGVIYGRLVVKPIRSGKYRLISLPIIISDRLGFFEKSASLSMKINVIAYPRVLPWIIRAIEFLEEAGLGTGEKPSRLKGRGLEYLWSREYQVGDDFSYIDWKASARLQKLFVKEFMEESYGSIGIVFDARAHGPVSRDECAAFLLSATISAATLGTPINLLIKRGDARLYGGMKLQAVDAVKIALQYVVESEIISQWDIYELLEPKSAEALSRLLRETGLRKLLQVVELKSFEAGKAIRELLGDNRVWMIYAGCVLVDSEFLIELAQQISNKGGRLTVLTPSKPWRDIKNLEEAYLMYMSFQKILRGLSKLGARIVHRPLSEQTLTRITPIPP